MPQAPFGCDIQAGTQISSGRCCWQMKFDTRGSAGSSRISSETTASPGSMPGGLTLRRKSMRPWAGTPRAVAAARSAVASSLYSATSDMPSCADSASCMKPPKAKSPAR
jgi:hypothetical protein